MRKSFKDLKKGDIVAQVFSPQRGPIEIRYLVVVNLEPYNYQPTQGIRSLLVLREYRVRDAKDELYYMFQSDLDKEVYNQAGTRKIYADWKKGYMRTITALQDNIKQLELNTPNHV